MFDPHSGLSILLHGVISLPNATSYDETFFIWGGGEGICNAHGLYSTMVQDNHLQ